MAKPRDTVGKLSAELLQQDTVKDATAGERMQQQLHDYEAHIAEWVNSGKNNFTGDFFVVVITKRERLMPNVMRNYFIPRKSCPTPTYDQMVYKFHRKDEALEFVWAVPSMVAVKDLLKHKHDIDPSFFALLKMVMDFTDGTLEKKAKTFNDESFLKKEIDYELINTTATS